MKMLQAFAKLPDWLRNGILVTAGALVGWFGNQYMDYRSAYKEALSANYEQFNQATDQIGESLKLFADIARGAKAKTDGDVDQLQARLLKAVRAADDLERRLGSASSVIEGYRVATVGLKHASDRLTGPSDAKPLVVAVSDYLLAEKRLRDTVVGEHNGFLY